MVALQGVKDARLRDRGQGKSRGTSIRTQIPRRQLKELLTKKNLRDGGENVKEEEKK